MRIAISPAASDVLPLLTTCALPTADITPDCLGNFFAIEDERGILGVVGLQLFGEVALLRSLAIDAGRRGLGLGRTLVGQAEERAQSLGVQSLYLLTTTAEAFFLHLGYERIDRVEAPEAIRSTSEFAHLCPASSALMRKRLLAPL